MKNKNKQILDVQSIFSTKKKQDKFIEKILKKWGDRLKIDEVTSENVESLDGSFKRTIYVVNYRVFKNSLSV